MCETDDDDERVSWIIVDTTLCSHQNSQTEWLTAQFIVAMKALCRGWIVKHWGDLYESQNNTMKSMSNTFVKQCVAFCSKVWSQKNEVFQDSENCRNFAIE